MMQVCKNINKVAIIGAGPAGVAAAKYLLAEKAFQHVDAFEQRANAGGVWNYTPENDAAQHLTIPQVDPFPPNEEPTWRKARRSDGTFEDVPTFISPLYESLEANLPKELMQHKGSPFPSASQLFPTHETITKYLEDYAEDVQKNIRYGTQVEAITRERILDSTKWSVTFQNLTSGVKQTVGYDAVLVANGHYTVPFIPDVEGIAEWNSTYPGVISHSKSYRRADEYQGKVRTVPSHVANPKLTISQKVVVVGKGYSGIDIAAQVLRECQQPLYISTRDPESQRDDETRKNLPNIVEFISPLSAEKPRSIRFGNDQVLSNVDSVIFCTGYLYSYPFISQDALSPPVITDGLRTRNVYQHIFYNADPTLAFLALPQKVVPFPISEGQAAVVAKVWAGRLALPDQIAMQQWEAEVVKLQGDDKKFHNLMPPADGKYLNELYEWAMSASKGANKVSTLNNDGIQDEDAKLPPRWDEKDFWIRERILPMKLKFNTLDPSQKQSVRSLKDLGYDFEEWLQQEAHNEK